jgi:hypothetical protein
MINTLMGSSDIMDLSSFKRTIGQVLNQFANYSQQDTQEFLISFLNEIDEEMNIRLQYFIYFLLMNLEQSHPTSKTEISRGSSGGNNQSNFVSPVSISNLPKTIKKSSNDAKEQPEDGEKINLLSQTEESQRLVQTPSQKEYKTTSSSSTATSIPVVTCFPSLSSYYNNSQYIHNLTHSISPVNLYFDNLIEVNMICMHCQKQFPPKYEHYHDFSFDLDEHNNNSQKMETSLEEKTTASNNDEKTTKETSVEEEGPFSIDLSTEGDDLPLFENLKQFEETGNEKEREEISLQSLFDKFFQNERVLWNCSSCGEKNCFVQIEKKIIYLSNYLIIHLKRFHYSMKLNLFQKIDSKISFDFTYDLSKYMKTTTGRSGQSNSKLEMMKEYHSLWNQTLPDSLFEAPVANNNYIGTNSNNTLLTFFNRDQKPKPPLAIQLLERFSGLSQQMDSLHSETEQEVLWIQSSSESSSSRKGANYEMSAVIRHLGGDMMSGHYISDVKNDLTMDLLGRDAKSNGCSWIRYNDMIANPIAEVSNIVYFSVSSTRTFFFLFLLLGNPSFRERDSLYVYPP